MGCGLPLVIGQMRIGDLREKDTVRLTCVSCGQGLELSGARVSDLAYGYRPLSSFAAAHACGWCGKIGATVDVRAAGDD